MNKRHTKAIILIEEMPFILKYLVSLVPRGSFKVASTCSMIKARRNNFHFGFCNIFINIMKLDCVLEKM